MNKNTALTTGIIAVVIIGGLVFYIAGNNKGASLPPPAGGPPPAVTPPPAVNPPPAAQNPAKPVVATSATTALTDTTAVVTGTVNPEGALTTYWYEYGKTSDSLGSKTANQNIGSGYTTMNAPGYITGLTKDTTYFFRLVAQNQFGKTMGTTFSFQTPHGYPPPPVGSAPGAKTIAASGVSRTTANLNGQVTSNKVETKYWFEYGKTTSLGNASALVSAGDDSTKAPVSLSLSDLDPGTTYYFRLNAQNQFGTVNGSILNFKTTGPAAAAPSVTTGNATAVTDSTATLGGSVDPNGEQTTYWFEYSTDSLLGSLLLHETDEQTLSAGSVRVSVTSDISDLTASTTYYFRLVAQNNTGISRGERHTFKTK